MLTQQDVAIQYSLGTHKKGWRKKQCCIHRCTPAACLREAAGQYVGQMCTDSEGPQTSPSEGPQTSLSLKVTPNKRSWAMSHHVNGSIAHPKQMQDTPVWEAWAGVTQTVAAQRHLCKAHATVGQQVSAGHGILCAGPCCCVGPAINTHTQPPQNTDCAACKLKSQPAKKVRVRNTTSLTRTH